MIPRPPAETPPPQHRGGFFRGLQLARPGARPASSAGLGPGLGLTGAVPSAPSSASENREATGEGSATESPRSSDHRSGSAFLEKLSLSFIERLWVDIKTAAAHGGLDVHVRRGGGGGGGGAGASAAFRGAGAGAGAGAVETIGLSDFLRLAKKLMLGHTPDDEYYFERLFKRVDRRKKGVIATRDIATALVLISNEDPIPKLRSLFRVFDSDDDSCLMHDEIFEMYLSIKANDITKSKHELMADTFFDDELSLQEARRLYELTVVHLKAVSDFIIFDEFKHIFGERSVGKFLLENLVPGSFSPEWILGGDIEPPNFDTDPFATEVRKGFVDTLRRGDEHLELWKRRGRGTRIMQSCLAGHTHRPSMSAAPPTSARAAPRGEATPTGRTPRESLPALSAADEPSSARSRGNAAKRRPSGNQGQVALAGSQAIPAGAAHSGTADGRKPVEGASLQDDADGSSESSSDGEDATRNVRPGMTGTQGQRYAGAQGHPGARAHGHHHAGGERNPTYSIEEVKAKIDQLPWLSRNHKNAKRFRTLKVDKNSRQAYLRERKDVNRTHRYQCLVCAVNHEFKACPAEGRIAGASSI